MRWIPYCGAAPLPADWLLRWNLDPVLLLALGATAALSMRLAEPARRRAAFVALGLFGLLSISPLCALSSALFSVRVAHHLLLATLVAPLAARAWPPEARRLGLASAAALHVVTLWLWHAPAAYEWALSWDAAFWAMQASLFVTALAFWRAVAAAPALAAAGALLGAMVATGLLGALIAFAAAPLYAPHYATTLAWGLAPLDDQRLAGLVMWVAGGGAYLAAALARTGRWLARPAAAL